jgi:hypothetical protein
MAKSKPAPPQSAWDTQVRLLAWLATCASVLSFLAYVQRGEIMLYGDAVAHINIARRVFDSKTPGLLQLGTVWLPLPHLLMIPFIVSTELWRRGGASVPSLVAYVFGVIGMFRLVRGSLAITGSSRDVDTEFANRVAPWVAAIVYAANPNLIYMQTTAMGESLYLAFFIWAIVFFSEFFRGDAKALPKCGWCLAAACLTRYDGWFLAAAMASLVVICWLAKRNDFVRPSTGLLARFLLIAAAGPILWLAYNGIVYRNPLEFENGPYSAKAIENRTHDAGNPGHPGSGNLILAEQYFVKAAEFNMAENQWLQRAWVLIAIGTVASALVLCRRSVGPNAIATSKLWPLLFLAIPLPFYALSVAYGSVPIFIPAWWPFTHYNTRYGLQMLPAFATALAFAVYVILRESRWDLKLRSVAVVALIVFVIASYASSSLATPITLREAEINMRTRNQLEAQLARWLEALPPNCTILMYLGDHVGALQRAGIPLRHTINEGNHRVWKQPTDSEGLWEQALADPPKYADYVIAFEGDPVWQAVKGRNLRALVEIHVTGQARATLYRIR